MKYIYLLLFFLTNIIIGMDNQKLTQSFIEIPRSKEIDEDDF